MLQVFLVFVDALFGGGFGFAGNYIEAKATHNRTDKTQDEDFHN